MSSKVPVAQVATAEAGLERGLPARVQEALGELVGAAQEGLLALSVGVGLGVLQRVDGGGARRGRGPEGPARSGAQSRCVTATRTGEVTLGGRRVSVSRPRARTADGSAEVPLATYAHFADRDPLSAVVLERMLAGVSTRRYRRTQEPVGADVEREARSTSKSAVVAHVRRAHARSARRADGAPAR